MKCHRSLLKQMQIKSNRTHHTIPNCPFLLCLTPGLTDTHQYSSPPAMHFSYIGPSSSRWLGKMASLWMMIVFMTSLTCAWHATGSWPSGMGIRVGPKQIAKLYGSIIFSSLYWERLRNRTTLCICPLYYRYYNTDKSVQEWWGYSTGYTSDKYCILDCASQLTFA